MRARDVEGSEKKQGGNGHEASMQPGMGDSEIGMGWNGKETGLVWRTEMWRGWVEESREGLVRDGEEDERTAWRAGIGLEKTRMGQKRWGSLGGLRRERMSDEGIGGEGHGGMRDEEELERRHGENGEGMKGTEIERDGMQI